mgnify:CR=1 FL=1
MAAEIPRRADRVQDFVVELDEARVFPKAVGIVGRRWHQIAFRAEVKTAAME